MDILPAAGVLAGQVRRGDVVAHTGGEEFAVLLNNCPTDMAQRRASLGALRVLLDGLRIFV